MYQKTVLDNGIRILTEDVPHVRSVAIGIWVNTGARHEDKKVNGIAHFIEHMLFKGTERRTAMDIAREMDSVGGILNAFTDREYTCFYAKVLEKHLPMAVDLLSDIFLNSVFDPEELEKERKVVLQEISMVEDTPDDYVHDFFNEVVWPEDPIGRPILGTIESINSLFREDMKGYMRERYIPGDIIITAAGSLNHQELANLLMKKGFGPLKPSQKIKGVHTPDFSSQVAVHKKKLEQVHLCLGARSIEQTHPLRYHNYILNTVLGGGMSSRLFQEIREKRGLAYSVYSYLNTYSDTGYLGVYVGTGEGQYKEVLGLVRDELTKLKDELIETEELQSAKEQIKGNLILGMESTDSWMTKLAKNEIYFGRDVPIDEVMAGIDAVTAEGVRDLAGRMFKEKALSLAVVGGIDKEDIPAELLQI
ncbi:MAG: pitrilysin family protein [Deltaproteobacteria bacterium]|nr:pitrilysin family protein [Deltaproteobacteria bacterium]